MNSLQKHKDGTEAILISDTICLIAARIATSMDLFLSAGHINPQIIQISQPVFFIATTATSFS